jgi:competence protein ComGC
MKIFNIQRGPRRTGELIGARSIAPREKVLNLAGRCPALRATAHVSGRINAAMTLIEVLMVLAVLMIMAAIFLPGLLQPRPHYAYRIQCVNNLKQVGLATRVWEGDNNDRYPTAVSVTNGGAMEMMTGPNAWRNFQVMSNELSTPKVLFCPKETDKDRFVATNFTFLNNSNLSFFVGVDAAETNVNSLLSGDHNITNGTPVKNGLLTLTASRPTGWTSEIHNQVGNLCLADGSVQQVSIAGLQSAVTSSGLATNVLNMPVLGP